MPNQSNSTYTKNDMKNAIEAVKRGSSIRSSAKINGVPRMTLSDKVKEKSSINATYGPKSYLSEYEKKLVQWIEWKGKHGVPLKKTDVLKAAQNIIKKYNIQTPFVNGRPGETWYKAFLKRNPKVVVRKPEQISKACDTMSVDSIQDISSMDSCASKTLNDETRSQNYDCFNQNTKYDDIVIKQEVKTQVANHNIDVTEEQFEVESKPNVNLLLFNNVKPIKQELSSHSEIGGTTGTADAISFQSDNCIFVKEELEIPPLDENEDDYSTTSNTDIEPQMPHEDPLYQHVKEYTHSNHYKRMCYRLKESRRQLKNSKRLIERLRSRIKEYETQEEPQLGSKKHHDYCLSYVQFSLPRNKSDLVVNIINGKNRYPDTVKDLALNLINSSPDSYKLLKDVLNLPSETSLRKFAKNRE